MNVIRLPVQKMTREAFAPYGVLLDRRGSVDVDIGMGVPSITGATADPRPLKFDFMARHRHTMQVFSPLAGSQAVVCVAPPNGLDAPDVDKVVAFLVEGRLPYAYFRGTWHTPPFATGEWYSYLVVDRKGTLDEDLELVDMRAARGCTFEIDVEV
jgi:ureidoglycolate hydrolase